LGKSPSTAVEVELAERGGFEPPRKFTQSGKSRHDTPLDTPDFKASPEMREIAAAWAGLPRSMRAAMLAVLRAAGRQDA